MDLLHLILNNGYSPVLILGHGGLGYKPPIIGRGGEEQGKWEIIPSELSFLGNDAPKKILSTPSERDDYLNQIIPKLQSEHRDADLLRVVNYAEDSGNKLSDYIMTNKEEAKETKLKNAEIRR